MQVSRFPVVSPMSTAILEPGARMPRCRDDKAIKGRDLLRSVKAVIFLVCPRSLGDCLLPIAAGCATRRLATEQGAL